MSAAKHVAIIMDGNGRWAKKRHLPRAMGHKKGVEAVRRLVKAAREMGLEALTLYAFSTENWRRSEDEISALMGLMKAFIIADLEEFASNNVRLKIIGDYKVFPADVVKLVDGALARTADNTGTILAVALNYGAQDEIVRAARRAAESGTITVQSITDALDTASMPPLDLLIRTSGEMRISNFLLWQIAYAELYVTDVLWPDFRGEDLLAACQAFGSRQRKFGGLPAEALMTKS